MLGYSEVPDLPNCKLIFGGATVNPEQLKAQLEEAINIRSKVDLCMNSMENVIKVTLMGKVLEEGVCLWGKTVVSLSGRVPRCG